MNDRKPVARFPRAEIMDDRQSLPIALLRAREAVMAYFRPHHRKGGITEQQWRVIRVLYLDGETDATSLARCSYLLAPSLSRIRFGRDRVDDLLALLADLETALADPPAQKDSRRKQHP
jgi:hypothetical protein